MCNKIKVITRVSRVEYRPLVGQATITIGAGGDVIAANFTGQAADVIGGPGATLASVTGAITAAGSNNVHSVTGVIESAGSITHFCSWNPDNGWVDFKGIGTSDLSAIDTLASVVIHLMVTGGLG
jgi:hypothetical protein